MGQPKETIEVLKCLIKIAALMGEQFKDGMQATDLVPIIAKMSQDPMRSMLLEAYNGADKIPSEIKEASIVEDIQMIAALWPELQDLIKSLSK